MRCLVFAPHPDDEILGCAALLARSREKGDPVRVIVVSNGALAGAPAQREAESRAGLDCLGVEDVDFWAEPDGALPLSGAIQKKYQETVRAWRPSHIALPSPYESHPDHRRLTRGLLTALEGQWQGDLLFYETLTPLAHPNRFEPLDLQLKLNALSCHASQIVQFDYLAHAKGLATVRGASLRQEAAEGIGFHTTHTSFPSSVRSNCRPAAYSITRSSPIQIVFTPGSPSHFRPKKPPSIATNRITSFR
jgi:LmbE family N-acetylglucosaminyl deacetylase